MKRNNIVKFRGMFRWSTNYKGKLEKDNWVFIHEKHTSV